MPEVMFQSVFNHLQEVLPVSWKKLVFYAGYTEGSYSMKFYIDAGDGQYIDCFQIAGVDKRRLFMVFAEIDQVLARERDKQDATRRWNVFTMIVDSSGAMHADFDYTNIDKNTFAYERQWQEKYLR